MIRNFSLSNPYSGKKKHLISYEKSWKISKVSKNKIINSAHFILSIFVEMFNLYQFDIAKAFNISYNIRPI